jgi:hypothetical protein
MYRQRETFMKRELGVEPSTATVDLMRLTEKMRGSEAAQALERRRKPGSRKDRAETQGAPAYGL